MLHLTIIGLLALVALKPLTAASPVPLAAQLAEISATWNDQKDEETKQTIWKYAVEKLEKEANLARRNGEDFDFDGRLMRLDEVLTAEGETYEKLARQFGRAMSGFEEWTDDEENEEEGGTSVDEEVDVAERDTAAPRRKKEVNRASTTETSKSMSSKPTSTSASLTSASSTSSSTSSSSSSASSPSATDIMPPETLYSTKALFDLICERIVPDFIPNSAIPKYCADKFPELYPSGALGKSSSSSSVSSSASSSTSSSSAISSTSSSSESESTGGADDQLFLRLYSVERPNNYLLKELYGPNQVMKLSPKAKRAVEIGDVAAAADTSSSVSSESVVTVAPNSRTMKVSNTPSTSSLSLATSASQSAASSSESSILTPTSSGSISEFSSTPASSSSISESSSSPGTTSSSRTDVIDILHPTDLPFPSVIPYNPADSHAPVFSVPTPAPIPTYPAPKFGKFPFDDDSNAPWNFFDDDWQPSNGEARHRGDFDYDHHTDNGHIQKVDENTHWSSQNEKWGTKWDTQIKWGDDGEDADESWTNGYNERSNEVGRAEERAKEHALLLERVKELLYQNHAPDSKRSLQKRNDPWGKQELGEFVGRLLGYRIG